MKISRKQLRKILLEIEGDSSESLQEIEFEIITNTGPGADFSMEDILIDLRGLVGVITVNQESETESLGFQTGMEKRFVSMKFDNSAFVDIPTLEVDIGLIPGVEKTRLLTVDGSVFEKEKAQDDYNQARSPEAKQFWKTRGQSTRIKRYEKPVEESKMKITRRQLKRIIKEEYSRMINEYGMGSEYDHLRSAPDLSGFEDPTDLETTVDELLSADGEYAFEQAFGRGSYNLHQDFDADGIYNGGRNIIAALERMGLEQSVPSIYEYVFQQWAKQNTQSGIFTDLSYDEYMNS